MASWAKKDHTIKTPKFIYMYSRFYPYMKRGQALITPTHPIILPFLTSRGCPKYDKQNNEICDAVASYALYFKLNLMFPLSFPQSFLGFSS